MIHQADQVGPPCPHLCHASDALRRHASLRPRPQPAGCVWGVRQGVLTHRTLVRCSLEEAKRGSRGPTLAEASWATRAPQGPAAEQWKRPSRGPRSLRSKSMPALCDCRLEAASLRRNGVVQPVNGSSRERMTTLNSRNDETHAVCCGRLRCPFRPWRQPRRRAWATAGFLSPWAHMIDGQSPAGKHPSPKGAASATVWQPHEERPRPGAPSAARCACLVGHPRQERLQRNVT